MPKLYRWSDMAIPLLRKKFTVQAFTQMAEQGILSPEERVELLAGELFEMGKIGRRHAAAVRRLLQILSRQVREEQAWLDVQNPIALDDYSQLQPDLTLLRPRADAYEGGHPQPADVLLLIEVVDTTLESDRTVKIPLYAQGGILEVWLVDLNGQRVTAYRQPQPDGYRLLQIYGTGDVVHPLAMPEVAVAIAPLFPDS